MTQPDSHCSFEVGDKDPCSHCPRKITALHMCGILQDELRIAKEFRRRQETKEALDAGNVEG